MDLVAGGLLFDGECDLVGAYEYAIRFATARGAGSMQLRCLRDLQREHGEHATALWYAGLLPAPRSNRDGSIVVARALVRFAKPRGCTAVLDTLTEQERRWCEALVPLWVAEQQGVYGPLLRSLILTTRRAVDWLAVGGRPAA